MWLDVCVGPRTTPPLHQSQRRPVHARAHVCLRGTRVHDMPPDVHVPASMRCDVATAVGGGAIPFAHVVRDSRLEGG
jgi:hypothetical protein